MFFQLDVPTDDTSCVPSPLLCGLEQRLRPTCHGFLAQELQQKTRSRPRRLVHYSADQRSSACHHRRLRPNGFHLGHIIRRTLPRSTLALHLHRCDLYSTFSTRLPTCFLLLQYDMITYLPLPSRSCLAFSCARCPYMTISMAAQSSTG